MNIAAVKEGSVAYQGTSLVAAARQSLCIHHAPFETLEITTQRSFSCKIPA